ncbi:hypothetical protein E8Q33_00025 [Methylophaga sp. SB9B]|uniref:autotransporter domain-containing protein n=1 Tax=Methylophaga sp. SB9B TaxID=2570356 RepID=UPI0010A850FA|nr:autotransporter domain-containing protein [Methylophaga sp. SB9B]THK43073.1 hypothetical protein E8Q33_00025 [Methylophaga sp. SB9B]
MNNRVLLPIALVLASQSTLLTAAEYVIGAKFSPTFTYDDNVQLREDKEGSFFTRIQPTLVLSRAEANSKITFNTGLSVERYTDLKDLDREDPFANFSAGWNTERSSYGLSASYAERAQRSIAEEDTGDFASNATVESINFAPTYSYQLTEKDSIYASYNYSERKYSDTETDIDNPLGTSFNDNKTHTVTSGWQRTWTERLTAGLALTYATYKSEGIQQSEYDTYNLAITSSYLLTEKWSISGQLGYRTLENEITPVLGPKLSDKSSGSLFNLSTKYTGEINSLSFSLSRSLAPSGEGNVNEQDRVSLTWDRKVSEKLSFNINTTYQESQTVDRFNTTDREYFQFSPGMSWKLQEDLNLRFGYQYREQKSSDRGDADGNMVFITVGYDWDGLRYSR